MMVLTMLDIIENYAKNNKKWCLYLSTNDTTELKELNKAVPFLSNEDCINLYFNQKMVIFFDNEQEMEDTFDLVIGDDGPTATNSYKGKARVYALTISNKGELLDENT